LGKSKKRKKIDKRRRASNKQESAPTPQKESKKSKNSTDCAEDGSSSGHTGLAVGRAGEERVIKAFLHINPKKIKLPEWWRGIRKGTQEEDAREVDCVVSTDVGEINIQIKTSLTKERPRDVGRTRRYKIPKVFINLKDSDAQIRKRVIRVVTGERKIIIKKKNKGP